MPKQRIMVTGANGQLGRSIAKINNQYGSFNIHFLTSGDLDITSQQDVLQFFENNPCDIIINCAAYTAVDKAEIESEVANQVNHLGAAYLAEAAKRNDLSLVHISTDYVFDGTSQSAYTENQQVNPINQYGLSKWLGEQAIGAINPKGIIIRTSWVYSEFGGNFVKTMLRLSEQKNTLTVVNDQIGSPTYATDLAMAIIQIINHRSFKELNTENSTYHYSNEGSCSWYDFAKKIFELQQLKHCEVCAVASQDYPQVAPRPAFTLLDKSKIQQQFDLDIAHWQKSLQDCLQVMVT